MTVVGTIGRTAVAPLSLTGANTARAVAVIPTTPLANVHCVEIALRDSRMRAKLTKAAHEVARKTLNLEDVRAVAIPLIPRYEQDVVVGEVERRLSIAEQITTQIAATVQRASRLRQAILKRAFEGKLVPQEVSDEPASVLLARIKAERQADELRQGRTSGFRRRKTVLVESATPGNKVRGRRKPPASPKDALRQMEFPFVPDRREKRKRK